MHVDNVFELRLNAWHGQIHEINSPPILQVSIRKTNAHIFSLISCFFFYPVLKVLEYLNQYSVECLHEEQR